MGKAKGHVCGGKCKQRCSRGKAEGTRGQVEKKPVAGEQGSVGG